MAQSLNTKADLTIPATMFVGLTTTLQNLLGFSITLSMEFYMIYFTMKVTAILLFSITMTDRLQISNLIVVR